MKDYCIYCGQCLEVCPQNAKTFNSDVDRIKEYLRSGEKVVISIAPSYLSVLDFEEPGQVVDALLKLGFSEVRETAEGAALVTKEYRGLIREGRMKNIISTCCPGVNDLVEKYYPELVPYLAPVVSPMVAHGRLIKKLHGEEVKTVFLGPCIAKKQEAIGDVRVRGAIDAILTFEEITQWWKEAGIDVRSCENLPMANPDPQVNRLYPATGGVITSVLADESGQGYQKIHTDGTESCMELLEELKKGEVSGCFFELNICKGGCVKGPASHTASRTTLKATLDLERRVLRREDPKDITTQGISMEKQFADQKLDQPVPTDEQLRDIMHKMGKFTKEDELNCGACGYSSCRDKAVAVFRGKAEVGMCLPHAISQAESMSNIVMDVTPNVILIIDNEMRIRECNLQALEKLEVSREEAMERYIFEFIETEDIEEVLRTHLPIKHRRIDLPTLGMVGNEIIMYIESMDGVLVIYQDITDIEREKEQHLAMKMATVDIAQKVIEKQMMVAQEIAGLLGETTAETKVTLTKLRDTLLDRGDA